MKFITRQEFLNLPYQEQWFMLVEFVTERYKRQPYLYYALHILTETYSHSKPFDASVTDDLYYEFDSKNDEV